LKRSRKLFLVAACFGMAPIAAAAGKNQAGGDLLPRAIRASNIRAEGAAPFSLKATFQFAHLEFIKAVQKSRSRPATRQGNPISTMIKVEVQFRR
jgi:hypothetical protein